MVQAPVAGGMSWLNIVDVVARFATTLAVLVGGSWALFNYIGGRIHRPRLRLSISAKRVPGDGIEYLIVKTELNNVGLAKAELISRGCCVKLHAHLPLRKFPFPLEPDWKELTTLDVFKDQQWVEPNGTLVDDQLIAVPGFQSRFLRVSSHVELKNKILWNTHEVALNANEVAERIEDDRSKS
jgi:hypothetical protein